MARISHRRTLVVLVVAACLAPLTGGDAWARARIPVGNSPQVVALNPATATLYVSNVDDDSVSVVDAACNARRCEVAKVRVGAGSVGVAINTRTNTIYVAANGMVSVIDGAACNARHTAGCARTPPTVPVGGTPLGIAVNEATNSIYVGTLFEGFLAIIDGRTCNRADVSGCGRVPPRITSAPHPVVPNVDEATNTIYVPDAGAEADGSGTTVAVFDGRACNGTTTAGCGRTATLNVAGSGPMLVDDVTRTLYVVNGVDGTVAVADGATCNGRVHSGCAHAPATAPVGAAPNLLALDQRSRTLYVVNESSDTVSAVAVARCNARDTSGCARTSPTLQVGQHPFGIELDPRTRTLYVTDSLDDDLFLFDAATCSSTDQSGCRDEAATVVTGGARDLAVAPALHTLYVTQPGSDSVAMIDTRFCNAAHLRGCDAPPSIAALGVFPVGIAVDSKTHTLYLNNMGDGTLSVIDAATCNVVRRSGCAPVAPPIPVGAGNAELAINPATHTVYVANGGDNTVSVIDAGHCNAIIRSGCGATPAIVAVGDGPRRVGIDAATNTIYVSNFGGGSGHTVSVIDGSGCDATATTSCGRTPATITVGLAPQGLVVDGATHTLYVANQAFNELPGTVSVVDTAGCNGTDASGCGQTAPTIASGFGPRALALDAARHIVYTANSADATASILRGAACNAILQSECDQRAPRVAVGDIPTDITVDATTGTVYVADSFASPPGTSPRGIVSVFAMNR